MSQRINYAETAAKLNYAALNQKLELLSQTEPPGSRNTALAMLEPLREKLLTLHRNGWSCQQLAAELKAAGVPATVARLRECLNHWSRGGTRNPKPRAVRRNKNGTATPAANQVGRNKSPTSEASTNFRLRES